MSVTSQLEAYSGNICVELFHVMNVGVDRAMLSQHKSVCVWGGGGGGLQAPTRKTKAAVDRRQNNQM